VLFYSHDGAGLGHRQRNLKIARRLITEMPGATALMVTGSPHGLAGDVVPGLDYIKLPTLASSGKGDRAFVPWTLDIEEESIHAMRVGMILAAATAFAPDLLLVEYLPTGVAEELIPTLEMLSAREDRPKVVLGVRDVMDDPQRARAGWTSSNAYETIERFYDRVLCYGSAEMSVGSEVVLEPLPAGLVVHCGYVGPHLPPPDRADARRRLRIGDEKLIVVTVGAGVDALGVIRRAQEALEHLKVRPVRMIAVAGPLMSTEDLERLRGFSGDGAVEILWHTDETASLLSAADLVITMGGYNTLTEVAASGCRALVMPRVMSSGIEARSAHGNRRSSDPTTPSEQTLRAEAFARRGLVELVASEAGPETIAAAIDNALTSEPPASSPLPLDGLANVMREFSALLADKKQAANHRIAEIVVAD
jgi:predicted glycosyltransferase